MEPPRTISSGYLGDVGIVEPPWSIRIRTPWRSRRQPRSDSALARLSRSDLDCFMQDAGQGHALPLLKSRPWSAVRADLAERLPDDPWFFRASETVLSLRHDDSRLFRKT